MTTSQLTFPLKKNFKLSFSLNYILGKTSIAEKYFFLPGFGANSFYGDVLKRVIPYNSTAKDIKLTYFFYNKALYKSFINKVRRGLLGLQYGFYSELITIGVGYRFEKQQKNSNMLTLNLGYSHFIYYRLPQNVNFRTLKNYLFMFSNDLALLTQTAYRVKTFRFPDSYKGKGIRYFKEIVPLKIGKQRQR